MKTWLPAEELLSKAGYNYERADDGKSITVKFEKKDVILKADSESKDATVPRMIEGQMYLPILPMAFELGMTAKWYPVSKRLLLTIEGRKDDSGRKRIVNSSEPGIIPVYDADHSGTNLTVTPYDAFDNNLATYWAESGKGRWIQAEFEKPQSVGKVGIYWHVGDTRKANFEIHVSEDGENFTKVFEGQSDGKTAGFEYYQLPENKNIRFVRIVGNCNETNEWNSIKELKFYY